MAAAVGALLLVAGGTVAGIGTMTTVFDPKPQVVTAPDESAAADSPAGEPPAGKQRAGEQRAGDTPVDNIPAGNIPAGNIPVGAGPAGDMPAGDMTVGGPAPAHPVPAPITKGQIGPDDDRSSSVVATDRGPVQAAPPAEVPAYPRTVTPPVTGRPAAPAPARPVVTTRTDTQTQEIRYATRLVHDSSLPVGVRRVQSRGVAGVRTLRYLVTMTDGHQTGRHLLDSTVTRPPKQQVVALGAQSSDQDDDQDPGATTGWGQGTWPWHHGDDDDGDCDVICLPWGRTASSTSEIGQLFEGADAIELGSDAEITNRTVISVRIYRVR